jgi:hypothetical protein
MHKLARFFIPLTPIIVTYGGYELGNWAFNHFNCIDSGKYIEPCLAYGINIQGFLGITLFWFKILKYPALILTALWLIKSLKIKN